ncbi:MAG: ABC transporter substrate-binding protein [Rhodospirillales bacterium]
MLNRRIAAIVFFFTLGLWLGLGSLVTDARAGLAEGARAIVEEMSADAVQKLTDQTIDRKARKQRMREMMNRYFNIEGIARWVLGRHWRNATDAERSEYLVLYEDLMIETYVDRFASYQGESLTIGKVDIRDGKDAIVSTVFNRPNEDSPIAVDWRVREYEGTFKVIDIMIEGVSMGQTQRSEFASAIKSVDGDLGAFLSSLRDRVETASAAAVENTQ